MHRSRQPTLHAAKSPPAVLVAREIFQAPLSSELVLLDGAIVAGHYRRSSIGEEIGGRGLVPARTMRATAAECLLCVTSQAMRKHLRDPGVGAGVAPEFMAKRDSELVGIRG
jgi:hypothetical protein